MIKLFKDGDMFCLLEGPNIMDGVVGLGPTPHSAMEDFCCQPNNKRTLGDIPWSEVIPCCNSVPERPHHMTADSEDDDA